MSSSLVEETYLTKDPERLAVLYDFLAAHQEQRGSTPPARHLLIGAGPGDQVELPEEVYRVLTQVVDALKAGLAVSIVPRTMRLTTQQAADLLGVSRPTLVGLLGKGEIPYEQHGTHRKLLLTDVLSYRERRKAQQYSALDALYEDDEATIEEVLARSRDARKAVAGRHAR